jgi:hypothetical protein
LEDWLRRQRSSINLVMSAFESIAVWPPQVFASSAADSRDAVTQQS